MFSAAGLGRDINTLPKDQFDAIKRLVDGRHYVMLTLFIQVMTKKNRGDPIKTLLVAEAKAEAAKSL